MELEDDGKIDFIFEEVQNVLQSLKQKIKDGSATNKDHVSVIQNVQENKSDSLPSPSYKDCFPDEYIYLSTKNKEIPPLENKVTDFREKESPLSLSYQSHDCSRACLMKMPSAFRGENPLQLPMKYNFQRRHAKTNSHSSALHVSYKAPCGRSLRNKEEVFRYLLETECDFLFTDNFSFNTYVQLTRNYPMQEEIVSDVDISNGVESVPISFCNEIDNKKLPQFKYRKTVWPRAYYLNNFSNIFTDSCDCSEGCIDITKCACLQLTARNAEACPLSSNKITTGYKYKRLQRQISTGIYECNFLCKCNRQMCQNRVVQHGPQVRLQVFKTEKKGWGVRCLDDIDRGTFVCIYSGRLLSRSKTEKPNAFNENRRETITKNTFSKKRKIEIGDCEIEVIPLELKTCARSAQTEKCSPKFSNNPQKSAIKMNCNSVSRIQCHSVIRSPKAKTVIIQPNGKKMGFASSESVISQNSDGFKLAQVYLKSKDEEMKEDASSNPVEDSEDSLLVESDVIDITKCREQTPPRGRCNNQATTLDNQSIRKELAVQTQKSQQEVSPAYQNQHVFCDKELPTEIKNTSLDCLKKFNQGNVFLLDATKEGNVGRFLNHSCCPNLLVQNVFVETHDRNFPLVAFFTNRYVKARTELTWDYGVFPVTKKMEKMTCALCPKDHEYSVLYFAQSENIAAHENCLLYSSALVECEDLESHNDDRSFDVESVKKEIYRGRKLTCKFCGKKGATVGCEVKTCPRSYHYFCAKNNVSGVKRMKKRHSTDACVHAPAEMRNNRFFKQLNKEDGTHPDAVMKVAFLKKCKEAGLLNFFFETLLEKLNLIQETLMNETASDSDYEEIGTLLFDCTLFEDTFLNFQAGI
ncbi:Histone-lysine N-methyltransferase SETDB2 [Galemys pyrenaicus]|uniref:Histone-lysine N-methyltransferase SETDB2 n=1 Tax=Galemys pyrenaicus TaxID=202257 RepID=A0A8J6AP49_GALPY|nr:Histone-lysine N-methyltransferase SETDB2 [Galemys pyrenaicus]